MEEVTLQIEGYRVRLTKDGAGIVVALLNPSGEAYAWNRLSSIEAEWLKELLA